jgi:hypothetical protein
MRFQWSSTVVGVLACVAGVAVIASIAYVSRTGEGGIRSIATPRATATKRDAKPSHDLPKPTQKNQTVAALNYPTASADLPSTIAIKYNSNEDKTEMVLRLAGLGLRADSRSRATDAAFRITSEFHGAQRDPNSGELSVVCAVVVTSSSGGVLALGSIPPDIVADGVSLPTRPIQNASRTHVIEREGAVFHETVRFKLETEQVLALAAAKQATIRVGSAEVILDSRHMADVKEFAARMNPRL